MTWMIAIIVTDGFVHTGKFCSPTFNNTIHHQAGIDIHPSHVCCRRKLVEQFIGYYTDTIRFLPEMS